VAPSTQCLETHANDDGHHGDLARPVRVAGAAVAISANGVARVAGFHGALSNRVLRLPLARGRRPDGGALVVEPCPIRHPSWSCSRCGMWMHPNGRCCAGSKRLVPSWPPRFVRAGGHSGRAGTWVKWSSSGARPSRTSYPGWTSMARSTCCSASTGIRGRPRPSSSRRWSARARRQSRWSSPITTSPRLRGGTCRACGRAHSDRAALGPGRDRKRPIERSHAPPANGCAPRVR